MKNFSLCCAAASNLRVLSISGVLAVCAIPYATTQSTEKAPPNFQSEGVVIEHYDTLYRYNGDGTGEKQVAVKLKLQSEAGLRQFSVLSFPFAAAVESAHLDRLVVHHPDGTSSETPSTDAMEMPAPVTQQAPLYSDLKLLQVPVRGLRSGDEMEYVVHMGRKNPEAPGQFWGNETFLKGVVALNETVTLDVPAGKYVQEWSGSVKPTVTKPNGRQVYVWSTNQLEPTNAKPNSDEDANAKSKDEKPDVAWTTFHSWAEVGAWYRALAAPRAVPTDALKAQAEEITRDSKTEEEQLDALYSYVSTHVRYVGIDFGIGRYQPHAAAEIFANQYGDCKDKDTLFEALLRAKGFKTAPALIGVRLGLVKEVPSPSSFNHVITTIELPSGLVWADTTPGVTPFRMLVSPLRDKTALVIPGTGDAHLTQTPPLPPFPFLDRFEADGTLTKDGDMTAQVKISYRSDSEIFVRAIAQYLAPAQWDKGTQLIANATGFSGTTSHSTFSRADDVSTPMQVSYEYNKKPFGDWSNFRIVPLFPVLSLPMVPTKEPSEDIDLGSPRTEIVVNRIKLPDGFGADLPDAVHVKTPYATLDKTYKLQDGELVLERQLVVLEPKVAAKSWQDYKDFAEKGSLGDERWIQLTSTSAVGNGPQPPRPGENSPEAAELVAQATRLEQRNDWDEALAVLEKAKAINPSQPFLWSNYGYIAMRRDRTDEARKHYEKELSLHPDEGYVARLYAGMLVRERKTDAAATVLKKSIASTPDDVNTSLMLAEVDAGDHLKDAIAVLQAADQRKPGDLSVMNNLGELLILDHQEAEASKIAAKLLDKAGQDPLWLNNAAYLVAESNGDLALAEQKSRASLDSLETQLSGESISEANQQSFGRTSLAVASWHTLGYVLWKEHKPEGVDYLEAAWQNQPSLTLGEHYGDSLVSEGRKKEAMIVYEMAVLSVQGVHTKLPALQRIRDKMKDLQKGGIAKQDELAPNALQDARTFKVKLSSACKEFDSATYRLQFSAAGVHDVLRVAGTAVPEGTTEQLKKISFPRLVPTHSRAFILRDAIFACSAGQKEGSLVLMPMGSIQAEKRSN